MKEADFALFSALWWPYADYEALRISTYLNIWVCLYSAILSYI